jgi:peptidylprolyl isomerase
VDGVTVTGNKGEQPKVTVTPGQPAPTTLVAKDVYEGTGDAMPAGGTGEWNYEGVLFSDGTLFDSSWERGQPITFGLDQVIPGWREGLVGMKAGGRRLLIIPPEKAYGNRALQGIPPNSTLVFVVDLEDVK